MKSRRYTLTITILILIFLPSCCYWGEKKPEEADEKVYMETTGYCNCEKCCGYYRSCWTCWMVPYVKNGPNKGKKKKIGITSDGSVAKKGTIAADITLYPYGTKIYIPGYGWGEVHDTGTAIKGNKIDLFFPSHKEALKWGRKKLWVWIKRAD